MSPLPILTSTPTSSVAWPNVSATLTRENRTIEARALGNPILLRRAISNLLRNATRHNHATDTSLSAPPRQRRHCDSPLSNTGQPLNDEIIDQHADPFKCADGRILTRGTGHGLGLAIVAAIASAHEGRLILEPNPGGGPIVQVDLPAAPVLLARAFPPRSVVAA